MKKLFVFGILALGVSVSANAQKVENFDVKTDNLPKRKKCIADGKHQKKRLEMKSQDQRPIRREKGVDRCLRPLNKE